MELLRAITRMPFLFPQIQNVQTEKCIHCTSQKERKREGEGALNMGIFAIRHAKVTPVKTFEEHR